MWPCVVMGLLVVLAAGPSPTTSQFVNLRRTKCNLDSSKGEVNDPCGSLYDGECKGSYCGCPVGFHEDKGLRRCVPGAGPSGGGGGGGGAFADLPFDFDPNKSDPAGQPKTPQRPPPQPQPPRQPPSGYNPNQPGYNPNQPGYNPNQPGYNPNQPGYNPNQPGYNPNQPGRGKGNDNVGEKAGGGVGGVLFILLVGGLVYFCCCRGGKHKQVMSRFQGLPFMGGSGRQQAAPGESMQQMQQTPMVQQDPNFSTQHTYIPPGGQMLPPDQYPQGQYPPPQQPYPPGEGPHPPVQPYAPYPPQAAPYVAAGPPPTGYPVAGQQPPPYTQQYQPNAPPP